MDTVMDPNTADWSDRKVVRPRDVAERTGLSLSTIYDAIHAGRLRATKISPKVWVIKPADVDAWLEANET
jgi:excisionase family DNA binding protein